MTGNWFPRLSPSGRHVAAGEKDLRVWLDDAPVTEPPTFEMPGLGGKQQWAGDDTIIASAHDGSGIYRIGVWSRIVLQVDPRGANELSAGGGWWAAYRPDTGIYQSDGVVRSTASRPAMHGPSIAYTDHEHGPSHAPQRDLFLNGQLLDSDDITAVRLVPGAVGYQ